MYTELVHWGMKKKTSYSIYFTVLKVGRGHKMTTCEKFLNISIFFYSWGVIEKLFENSWTIKTLGLRPRASNSFLVFGTLMKPDARVFEKVRHHTRSSWTHPKGGPLVYLKPYLQPWCNTAVFFLFWISFVALSNFHEWTCLICLLTLLWTHMKVFVLANAVRC